MFYIWVPNSTFGCSWPSHRCNRPRLIPAVVSLFVFVSLPISADCLSASKTMVTSGAQELRWIAFPRRGSWESGWVGLRSALIRKRFEEYRKTGDYLLSLCTLLHQIPEYREIEDYDSRVQRDRSDSRVQRDRRLSSISLYSPPPDLSVEESNSNPLDDHLSLADLLNEKELNWSLLWCLCKTSLSTNCVVRNQTVRA